MLRNSGFDFKKNYCFNGDIIYALRTNTEILDDKIEIFVPNSVNKFEFVIISDIHFGSLKERRDYLECVYDYCIKSGIHTILIGGDLIDGTIGSKPKKLDTVFDQIEHLRKDYPFDNSIINYTVLGDHDYSALTESGQDLAIVLKNYRHDIVPLGYCYGRIWLKNDYISVTHPIKGKNSDISTKLTGSDIVFKGHNHNGMSWNSKNSSLTVTLPTLCDLRQDRRVPPNFIRGCICFQDSVINHVTLSQLLISNNYAIKFNEFTTDINSINKRNYHISYEELLNNTSGTLNTSSSQTSVSND
jgi:hypothetical protein